MATPYSWVVLQSRRGLKELDLVLEKFNVQLYHLLVPEQQSLYHQLLQESDQDLWDWFFHLQPTPEKYSALVEQMTPAFA